MNGAYEVEFAVRFELVANNDLLIYTDPNTDLYTNNNNGAMLVENQTNLDATIGDANYDIGHVFGTAGGGLANLRSAGTGLVELVINDLRNPTTRPLALSL